MSESSLNPASLIALLRQQAEILPDRLAFAFLGNDSRIDSELTYAQLDVRAQAIGAFLQSAGAFGERVLLVCQPGLDYVAAFFGCLYAGAIAVPAYPPRQNRSIHRLEAIAADAQPIMALTNNQSLTSAKHQSATIPYLSSLHWQTIESAVESSITAWQSPNLKADALACLQYTSGATASPKGVMLSHSNLLHNSAVIQSAIQSNPEDRAVIWLPPYHDLGLIGGIIQPLYAGFPVMLMSPYDALSNPLRWLQAMSDYGATISGAPNFAYERCIRAITLEQRERLDLSQWRIAFSGGEPIRTDTLDRFSEAFETAGFQREAWYPCYGLAEATLVVTGGQYVPDTAIDKSSLQSGISSKFSGCGHPLSNQDVIIVDPQTHTQCSPSQVGEIWVAGPSVAQGYWHQAEETKITFHALLMNAPDNGPFLRTGDLGYLKDNNLYITGRLKDLIIIRGRNHYPQDIELTVMHCHVDLALDGVAAFTMEMNGETILGLAAEIKRIARHSYNSDAVIAAIRKAVSEAHDLAADAIILVKPGGIPKTSSGKIQRFAVREAYLKGELTDIATWIRVPSRPAPKIDIDSVQAWLTNRLANHLNVAPDRIDPQASFASFGLDSESTVSLAAELAANLERPVSPALAYKYPTIEALAQHLTEPQPTNGIDLAHQAHTTSNEPIAIIGMGCRFPKADNPDAFWQLLCQGIDAVGAMPPERPATAYQGGFLSNVDQFDADFFGITASEANQLDPQQRLLLEVTWEALEDAGLVPKNLAGSRTGVFIGMASGDYAQLQLQHIHETGSHIGAHAGTGGALGMAANRLSYFFDWLGPSLTIDTACSASLVAVHTACQSLRNGEATLAVAGGVNLILLPEITAGFDAAGLMAADGRCKAFDARADGYVRGEGVGLIVLKPLTQAIADSDSVYAIIRGSAINQDGRTNGLTAPNPTAQSSVIRAACQQAGIRPSALQYIETHGTGTALGDPIEVAALADALSDSSDCAIGSVKTNIGHLEAASGIAGLIKVALSMKHQYLPPNLHYKTPNPHIPFDEIPLYVQTKLTPWPHENRALLAGLSSFGFGGTNAHIILEAMTDQDEDSTYVESSPSMLALSAQSSAGLRTIVKEYLRFLMNTDASLHDICYTAAVRRSHHTHKLAIIGGSHADFVQQLTIWLEHQAPKHRQPAPPHLKSVADAYMADEAIDWRQVFPHGGRHVNLPMYPWQHKRYWYDIDAKIYSRSHHSDEIKAPFAVTQGNEQTWIYGVAWQSLARAHRSNKVSVSGTWIVFADDAGIGEALAADIASHNNRVVLVFAGQKYVHLLANRYQIRAGHIDDLRMLFVSVSETYDEVQGIIHLWSLNAPTDSPITSDTLNQAQILGCESILSLLKLGDNYLSPVSHKLWLVTSGAQSILDDAPTENFFQAPLWGLARTIAQEYGNLWGGIIDLDPTLSVPNAVIQLQQFIQQQSLSDQVVVRGDDWYSPQFQQHSVRKMAARPTNFRPDGTYLITGGLGGLGLHIARWLVSQGARRLILISRTALPERNTWTELETHNPAYEKVTAVRAMETMGASIHIAAVDVGDKAQLQSYLMTYRREGWPPIRGVFHTAGVLHMKPLNTLDATELRAMFNTKVHGTWLLHHILATAPLDFFVLFSSASSVMHTPKLGGYAAANAFLDAMADYRQRLGLPALSINWGPWSKIGLTARPDIIAQLPQQYSARIDLEQGLSLFSYALRQPESQLVIVPNANIDAGFINSIPITDNWLRNTPPSDRFSQIRDYLCQRIAHILDVDWTTIPDNKSVLELGLDSLSSMDVLRNIEQDFGVRLYSRELMKPASVHELSAYLLEIIETSNANNSTETNKIAPSEKSNPRPPEYQNTKTQKHYQTPKTFNFPDRASEIIFILSSPRSGSTLLRVMLAGHSALFCPPELHLLPFDTLVDRRQSLQLSYLDEGLQRALMALLGLDAGQSKALLSAWEQESLPISEVYSRLQALTRPAILVDKSPTYALDLATLERAEHLFPNARYIHLIRHPIAAIDSFVRNRMDQLFDTNGMSPHALAEHIWTTGNRNIQQFLEKVDQSRQHQILFEALVTQPEVLSQQLCQFLDISYDPLLLTPYEGHRMTDGVHAQSLAIGDPNFLTHTTIDASLADAWQHVSLPHRLADETLGIASKYRYAIEDVDIGKKANPVGKTPKHQFTKIRDNVRSPVSHQQRAMWILSQLLPSDSMYTMPAGIFQLSGPLDTNALERALTDVVKRHAVLRTNLIVDNGELYGIVNAPYSLPLTIVNLQTYPPAKRESIIQEIAIAEFKQPFDLGHGPLLRAKLLQLSDQSHTLLLFMHHAVADGWSLVIFFREVAKLYRSYVQQGAVRLAEPTTQYVDYARWQQNQKDGVAFDAHLAFWQQYLANAPLSLTLPTDNLHLSTIEPVVASQSIQLTPELSQSINAFSQQHSATPFITLMTALKIMLFEWTGQADMVIGTVAANRDQSEWADLIGCLVSFLPIRSKIGPDQTGLQFLATLKATILDVYAHQDCPFEAIVETINPHRAGGQNPLYNIALVLQNFPQAVSLNEDVTVTFLPLEVATTQLDLRFVAHELSDGLYIRCEYRADLFASETIQQLLEVYRKTLSFLLNKPNVPISSFPKYINAKLAGHQVTQVQEHNKSKPMSSSSVKGASSLSSQLAIVSTFTAEPVEDALQFWIDELGLETSVQFAPYNQVIQQLLDPTSLLSQNVDGINVILIRLEDWLRFYEAPDPTTPVATTSNDAICRILSRQMEVLVSALETATKRHDTPYLVCICPEAPKPLIDDLRLECLNTSTTRLSEMLGDIERVYVVTPDALSEMYPVEHFYDSAADRFGHVPYTEIFYVALGTVIMRKLNAIAGHPYKVIVLDCDQTLWQGYCGETGPSGIVLDAPHLALQAFMVAQYEAGMLICLCSKNHAEDVAAVFTAYPDMPLKEEHIVAQHVNWLPKSENIRSLADELQLGLDSFMFIDDDPLACAEVEAACPEVLVLQLPSDASQIPQFLAHVWAFDHVQITGEDRQRTALYKEHLQREGFRREAMTFDDFLAGLEISLDIMDITPDQYTRVAQLTQRANQFNTLPIRRTSAEVETLCQSAYDHCLSVHVQDRFGEYGLVGAMMATSTHETMVVEAFLLSCRTLGRGVEHQMLAWLGKLAEDQGCTWLEVPYHQTKRNQLVLDFLNELAFDLKTPIPNGWLFKFAVDKVANNAPVGVSAY